jgi:hypothetical protein
MKQNMKVLPKRLPLQELMMKPKRVEEIAKEHTIPLE